MLALTCLTPVDERHTRITQVMWSDHPAFTLLKPFIAGGARKFLRQDAAMVNLQNQGLAYDPTLLWIDDADAQAKWYQALKREWTASRAAGRPFTEPGEADGAALAELAWAGDGGGSSGLYFSTKATERVTIARRVSSSSSQ